MRKLLAATLVLSALFLTAEASAHENQAQTQPLALHLVRKIYVDDFGPSDEAQRFKMLLEDKLSKNGFTVVNELDKADAILTGILSVTPLGVYVPPAGVYGGETDVRVTVELKASNKRLWLGNTNKPLYGRRISFILIQKYRDPVEFRAEEIASKLQWEWKKSAASAGIKVSK